MNDTFRNADLPRPRQMPEQMPCSQQVPPLKRRENHQPANQTQEFSLPKHKISSDAFPTQEMPVPDMSAEDDNDSGYGAYEEYDQIQLKSSGAKKQVKKSSSPQKKKKQNPEPVHKKPKKKHHGGGILKRIIRRLVIFVVILFAIYSAVAILLIRQLEKLPRGERAVTSGTLDTGYVRSVLLIGTDARDISTERGRSDTMLLLSLNSRTQTIYLTSFMRDAYVQIPGYGNNKLNAAYSFGGAELLMDTLEQNYQVSIDDYCVVSFMGFASIIDAFGGVEISLSDEEASAVNVILQSEVNGLAGDDPLSDFLEKGGTYLLNGKQALSYARIRYVGNADFERTSRQREVMMQLLQHAKSKMVTAVPELISSAMPHLGTNMSDAELYFLSLRVPSAMGYDITQIQVPADGTYTPADIDGQSVLQVDFGANIQILQDSVYSAPAETEPQPVQ